MNKDSNSHAVTYWVSLVLASLLMGAGLSMTFGEPEPKAPTYHCDGPGYPAPGTLEARACWIEK